LVTSQTRLNVELSGLLVTRLGVFIGDDQFTWCLFALLQDLDLLLLLKEVLSVAGLEVLCGLQVALLEVGRLNLVDQVVVEQGHDLLLVVLTHA